MLLLNAKPIYRAGVYSYMRIVLRYGWLLALSPMLFLAQSQTGKAPASAAPAPATALVEGTVMRASDGKPLKRAQVTLRPQFDNRAPFDLSQRNQQGRPRTFQGVTDASGKFSIAEITPGRYRLSVDRQGYVRAEYGQRAAGRPGATLTLDPGQKLKEMVFRLLDDAVITGRVTDEDGEPVVNGYVQTLRLSYQRGQKQFFPSGGAQTNDRGEYRIFGLSPGRYYVSATAGGSRGGPGGGRDFRILSNDDSQDEVYAPTFYPGTTDPQNASPMQVGPGDEIAGIDLSIAPQRAFRVRGRITAPPASNDGPQNSRRGGLQAMLMRQAAPGSYSRAFAQQGDVDQDQGTFEFRAVLPGSYVIQVISVADRRATIHRESVEVGRSDVDGVHIVMNSGVDLSGKVRLEGDAGTNLQAIRVQLIPAAETFTGGTQAAVSAEGTFNLQGVPPSEKHFVSVQGIPQNFYLKSAKIGGEEVSESGLQMSLKGGGSLEIVMNANGGRVEGTVLDTDSLPATAVTVVLVPAVKRRANSTFYRTALTDAQGKFSMIGIPPGDYKLFSWDDVDQGAWQDPEFLAPFEEKGLRITIVEGTTIPAEVRLITNK